VNAVEREVRGPTAFDVDAAFDVVRTHLRPTPLVRAPALGDDVFLKLETLQPTGSFKVRGALAAVAALVGPRRSPGAGAAEREIIAASAGNHGLGIAYAARVYRLAATIVVPENASPRKLDALDATGAIIVRHGGDYDAAEAHALTLVAEREHALFISPYNDPHVIAGQASIARELTEQLPDVTAVLAPVGGGGLLSGLAVALPASCRVIGVGAAASPAVRTSVEAGRVVDVAVEPTLADGLAGNLEAGSITVDLLRERNVAVLDASEDAIAEAVRFCAYESGLVVEGSAATAIVPLLDGRIAKHERSTGPTVAVITGRNIAPAKFAGLVG
jgi:threonine dehydratase